MEGEETAINGTNLVAYNRVPRDTQLECIYTYLKAVTMEAPEKLTPVVLRAMVEEIPKVRKIDHRIY